MGIGWSALESLELKKSMRVLLTGHKGYIGVVLAQMLSDGGHEVHGLDSDLFRRCTSGAPPPAIPETCKDIRDVESVDLEGYDAVLHLRPVQ